MRAWRLTPSTAAWHCHPEAAFVNATVLVAVNYHVYTCSTSVILWQCTKNVTLTHHQRSCSSTLFEKRKNIINHFCLLHKRPGLCMSTLRYVFPCVICLNFNSEQERQTEGQAQPSISGYCVTVSHRGHCWVTSQRETAISDLLT